MFKKAWIYSIIVYALITAGLIFLFDSLWPENKVWTLIIPFVVSGLITHLIRKLFDFIADSFKQKSEEPVLGIIIKADNAFRRFVGYGASCGEVIQAGNFKSDYELEADLDVIIQNESSTAVYGLNVGFTPNQYSANYTLIDSRENKLQPLEGNKNVDFKIRIAKTYYDVYASDVDKDLHEIYKVGKSESLLHGSELIINYLDSRHKAHSRKEVIK